MPKIIYYRSKCIGCNGCVEAAPDRWRVSKRDGRSTLVHGIEKKSVYSTDIGYHEYEANKKAEANCPVRVIQVKE
ncbi:MAG: ferredoxin [Cyclobacteriaceae bacterium]